MQMKLSKGMGFWTILIAGLFLWNPVWGFSDPLPDLIGYLLLWGGLAYLADLNDSIFESRKGFQNLVWVGAGELLIRSLLKDAEAAQTSVYQQPTWILLFSFVLLVLQWWLLIPALKKLFVGIDHLADKHQNERLMRLRRERTQSERMARLSMIFVVVRTIFAVLPELAILTSFEYQANNERFGFDWYEYIGLFRTVGVAISLIFCLIWLIALICYVVRILRDGEWLERLRAAYIDEILPQEGMLKARRLCAVLSLLSVGILFVANLRIDEQVALTGAVFALAVGASAIYLGEMLPDHWRYRAPCIALAIVAVGNVVAKYAYLQRFTVEASEYQIDAFWFFTATQLLEILEAALTLLVIWKTIGLLLELVRAHTEVNYRTPGSEVLSQNATARLHRSFENRAALIRVVFSIAAVGYMFEAILQLSLEWLWLIPFGISLLGICLFLSFLHELSTQIRWKYLSDGAHKKA